jgi:hypothetical protein
MIWGRFAAQSSLLRDEVWGGILPVNCHRFECKVGLPATHCLLLEVFELSGQSPDREFGWGGTPAKSQRWCPEAVLSFDRNEAL